MEAKDVAIIFLKKEMCEEIYNKLFIYINITTFIHDLKSTTINY